MVSAPSQAGDRWPVRRSAAETPPRAPHRSTARPDAAPSPETRSMNAHGNTWALVLAAGEGTRLASLTTGADGRSTPKQYCSLDGGRSLLGDALARAELLVPRERIVVVVARQHEALWRR